MRRSLLVRGSVCHCVSWDYGSVSADCPAPAKSLCSLQLSLTLNQQVGTLATDHGFAAQGSGSQGEQTTLSSGQLRLRSWHLWAGHRRPPLPRQCPDSQHGQPVGPRTRATQAGRDQPIASNPTVGLSGAVHIYFFKGTFLKSLRISYPMDGWVMPAARPTPGLPWGRT